MRSPPNLISWSQVSISGAASISWVSYGGFASTRLWRRSYSNGNGVEIECIALAGKGPS
jgi:hypothetical protein